MCEPELHVTRGIRVARPICQQIADYMQRPRLSAQLTERAGDRVAVGHVRRPLKVEHAPDNIRSVAVAGVARLKGLPSLGFGDAAVPFSVDGDVVAYGLDR